VWRTDILPLLEEHHFGDRTVDVRTRYGLDAIRKALKAKVAGAATEEVSTPAESGDDGTAAANSG
jgi:5-methylcytosine-specific restriction protein B